MNFSVPDHKNTVVNKTDMIPDCEVYSLMEKTFIKKIERVIHFTKKNLFTFNYDKYYEVKVIAALHLLFIKHILTTMLYIRKYAE